MSLLLLSSDDQPLPERALRAVGELLAFERESVEIVILGGSALILLDLVRRTTTDVDILALGGGPAEPELRAPEPLPEPLLRAIATVAADFGLADDWMNATAGLQWKTGLPPGLEQRLEWRRYESLSVGLVSRYDLVFFKLFAAADDRVPESVHYQDLLALRPIEEELSAAVAWLITQDVSDAFRAVLDEVVMRVKRDVQARS